MGYIFDNVPTDAAGAKGSIRLFTSSCIILLEYWQFQWCNGNNNWSEVSVHILMALSLAAFASRFFLLLLLLACFVILMQFYSDFCACMSIMHRQHLDNKLNSSNNSNGILIIK